MSGVACRGVRRVWVHSSLVKMVNVVELYLKRDWHALKPVIFRPLGAGSWELGAGYLIFPLYPQYLEALTKVKVLMISAKAVWYGRGFHAAFAVEG